MEDKRIAISHEIERRLALYNELSLQVRLSGGCIDLYDETYNEYVTSWSDEEIMEYQDREDNLLLEGIMFTALYYNVRIKVVDDA